MMNIPPGEAKKLSLWEFEAILWNHNEAHSRDDDGEIQAPDPATAMPILDLINSNPLLTQGKPKKGRNLPSRQPPA